MRRILKSSLLVLCGFILFTLNVNAEVQYYTNNNGIVMTELQYNKLLRMFPESKVANMTQDEFDTYKDATIITSDALYEKTTYINGQYSTTEYVTEEEYNSAPVAEVCGPTERSNTEQFIETSYKKLYALIYMTNDLYIMAMLNWKTVPLYRSYDVFAMRFQFINYYSPTGQQDYWVDNVCTNIFYNTNSAGYKTAIDGFGFSMNLKDGDDITKYDMFINSKIGIENNGQTYSHAFVTYQHARANLTRAQSMMYTFDINGLGNVLWYTDQNVHNAYDGMSGLHLIYSA